ncbi:MAG: hypothetical protein R6W76_17240 [Caldilinea sp.]
MNSPRLDATESPAPATADPSSRRNRRPFGLYMILILLTLQGLIGVLLTSVFGLGLLLLPGETWAEYDVQLFELIEPLILLLITLVVLVGLWRYRAWGWYGMMLLLAYWMATDAIGYFTGSPAFGSMLLSVAMVFYLNQREVRDLFDTTVAGKVST